MPLNASKWPLHYFPRRITIYPPSSQKRDKLLEPPPNCTLSQYLIKIHPHLLINPIPTLTRTYPQLYGPNGRDGKKGMAKAYDIFFKVSAKHMDAGFYMGEILMGREQMHANLKFAIPHVPKKTVSPSSASSSSSSPSTTTSTSSSSSSSETDSHPRDGHSSTPLPPRPPSRVKDENNEDLDQEAYADQHPTGAVIPTLPFPILPYHRLYLPFSLP